MKKTIFSSIIFFLLLCMCIFSSSKVEASTLELDGITYTINTSNEYDSETQVDWITIASDRSEGSRISVEFDINALKDYNSTDGLIYHSVVKQWLNKLEEAFDYFCKLNTYPQDETLVVEWTGVSKQYASAYVTVYNNKIVMNKEYHKGTLKRMQHAYEQGIIDICGTVLHEMGHKFTGSSKFTNGNVPWNVGVEYINLIFVQYVLDNLVQNNDNIVSSVYSYYDILCASEEVIEKGYTDFFQSDLKLYNNYATCWEKIKNETSYENAGDVSYVDVLVNYTKMLDILGKNVVINTFSTYFTDVIDNYNTSTLYDSFITFTEILKSNTTDEVWEKVSANYNELYNKYVVNINLDESSYDIIKGKTKTIGYNYSFNSSHHDDFTPEFSSRNTSIATVNSSGVITAQNEGTTQIRVKVGNQYALVTVNVLPEDTKTLELKQISYTFTNLDDTLTLNPDVSPSSLSDYLEWSSNNTSVATVSNKGVVTPVSDGWCTITVKTTDGSNLSASCKIYVDTTIYAESIEFEKSTYYITSNESINIKPTVLPENTANKRVVYASTDTSIATIDEEGNVTPVSNGTCKIQAMTTDGTNLFAECNIRVDIRVYAESIEFKKSTYYITSNESINIKPTVLPENTANKRVVYASTDTSIATIDEEGNVTPVSNGTCKIQAMTTDGTNLFAECEIIVNIPIKVTGISISTTDYIITNINQTPVFAPTITPSNATNKNVKWTSSNTNVATVTTNGIIKGVGNGKCTITATTVDGSNLSASINITVNIPALGYKKGDINKDGMININDIIYGGKGFTNGTVTDEEKEIGNVNGDSVFNVNDLIKIMKYVVGKISTLD